MEHIFLVNGYSIINILPYKSFEETLFLFFDGIGPMPPPNVAICSGMSWLDLLRLVSPARGTSSSKQDCKTLVGSQSESPMRREGLPH